MNILFYSKIKLFMFLMNAMYFDRMIQVIDNLFNEILFILLVK